MAQESDAGAVDPFGANSDSAEDDRGAEATEPGLSIEALPLKTASDLMPRSSLSDSEMEQLGLNAAAGTYKNYEIVKMGWQHPSHGSRPDSFYVRSSKGDVGWVPWVGSPVVWPWEAAWVQDLKDGPLRSNLKKVKS